MKKIIFLISTAVFVISCNNEKPSNTNPATQEQFLESLEAEKTSYIEELNALNKKLDAVNQAILGKSETKKQELVTSFEVQPQAFEHTIEVQANVRTRQSLELLPEFGGRLNKILVKEGQKVKKGSLLAQIDDSGLQDQLEQMQLQLELAKTTFDRTERLWNQKIGSEMMYLEAKTRYLTAEKQVAQMQEQLAKTKVYAPFSGVIDEIIAKEGGQVAPGMTPLLRLINLDNMYVESSVPENYLVNITEGSKASVYIPVLNQTQETVVRQTGNYISPGNRTFRVEAPLENAEGLIKPNLSARLSVIDYANPKALMIPLSIVRENAAGQKFVFVLTPTETEEVFTAQLTFVELGKSKAEMIEVTQGLEPNALVVDEGFRLLQDQQIVKRISTN